MLPDELCSDERESGGARILVWRQPTVQGVRDEESVYCSRVLLPPLFFLASAAHTHQSLPALSHWLVPPSSACIVLTTREQISFVSSPTPSLVFGGFAFPNTARPSWHTPPSEPVFVDHHGFILCFKDQFPGYMNVGNWHRPGHGHGHRRAEPECLLHAGHSMIFMGRQPVEPPLAALHYAVHYSPQVWRS